MDENILTGEAVPVRKGAYCKPAGTKGFDPAASKSCMLYGGTTVAQVGMQLDEGSLGCAPGRCAGELLLGRELNLSACLACTQHRSC